MKKQAPILLDLFCGAGGAAKGYADVGFTVVGVDKEPQPNYPYIFYQYDALKYLGWYVNPDRRPLFDFAAVHASPPCQAYSRGTARYRNQGSHAYPELIEPVRDLLRAFDRPYVIENVPGAPLENPVTLCGAMREFPELRVLRHRLFETSFPVPQPPHPDDHPLVMTHDKRKAHYKKLDEWSGYVGVYGGGQGQSLASSADAMAIDWMMRRELAQAVPPPYTRYIGEYLMKELEAI